MTTDKARIASAVYLETPDRIALVLIGWGSAPPGLERLFEQGVPVYYVRATDEIDGLITDPGLAFYREKRISVIVAFEHAKDAYTFEARLAASEGRIQ